MAKKLKPLPIWSLEVGHRVRVKGSVRPHGGKLGTVVDLVPSGYMVRLDLMGLCSNPHDKLYKRDELKLVDFLSETAKTVIRGIANGADVSWEDNDLRIGFKEGHVWFLAKTVVKELVLAARIEERR